MVNLKKISRFLLFRFFLLGTGVLVLGGLVFYFFSKMPPKETLAVTGTLVLPSTTQTFTTTNLNVTNLVLGGTTVTATAAELNYVGGATSALQTQMNLKAPLASPTFTGTVVLPSTTSIGTITDTELGYVDGVTSNIQTQMNTKAPIASPTFTTATTSPFYKVVAGEGNGICFWADCTNYKFSMGTAAEYLYGPVTTYSIKSTMNSTAGRGWTWGQPGVAPVAAISNTGVMQLAGTVTAPTFSTSGNGAGITSSDATWLRINPASAYFRAQYLYQDGPVGYVASINSTLAANYVPKADGQYRITNSQIIDNGTNVGIGTTAPGAKLDVNGAIKTLGSDVFAQSDNTNTAYSYAPIQIREAMYGATSGYLPPRLSFHWGGVVASQIGIESTGRIAILNNPGTGYENLISAGLYLGNGNNYLYQGAGGSTHITTPYGYVELGPQNSSWAHIQTDRANFYFNTGLTVDTGNISSYNTTDLSLRTGTTTRIFAQNSTGNVGIGTTAPTYKLQVGGSVYMSGSSRRFKQNIAGLEVDSERIYDLRPVSFDYKPAYKSYGKELGSGRQIGLIAEEVYNVIPELAVRLDGKISNVDYEKLSVLLLSETQKQKKEIDSLKLELKTLNERLLLIESKLK